MGATDPDIRYKKILEYLERKDVLEGLDKKRIERGKRSQSKHSLIALILAGTIYWVTDYNLEFAIMVGVSYYAGFLIGQGTIYSSKEKDHFKEENF